MTYIQVQPVMEFCLPMRCSLPLSYASRYDSLVGDTYEMVSENSLVDTNINGVVEGDGHVRDLLYRKRGSNFALYHELLIPPYALWGNRGFAIGT